MNSSLSATSLHKPVLDLQPLPGTKFHFWALRLSCSSLCSGHLRCRPARSRCTHAPRSSHVCRSRDLHTLKVLALRVLKVLALRVLKVLTPYEDSVGQLSASDNHSMPALLRWYPPSLTVYPRQCLWLVPSGALCLCRSPCPGASTPTSSLSSSGASSL